MTLITAVKLDWTEHAHWTTFNPTVVGCLLHGGKRSRKHLKITVIQDKDSHKQNIMAALCKYTQWSTDQDLFQCCHDKTWIFMRLQVYTQQINKISDFKLSSDLLNIVLPIYILTAKQKKAWVRVNNTLSNTQLGAGSFIVEGGFHHVYQGTESGIRYTRI